MDNIVYLLFLWLAFILFDKEVIEFINTIFNKLEKFIKVKCAVFETLGFFFKFSFMVLIWIYFLVALFDINKSHEFPNIYSVYVEITKTILISLETSIIFYFLVVHVPKHKRSVSDYVLLSNSLVLVKNGIDDLLKLIIFKDINSEYDLNNIVITKESLPNYLVKIEHQGSDELYKFMELLNSTYEAFQENYKIAIEQLGAGYEWDADMVFYLVNIKNLLATESSNSQDAGLLYLLWDGYTISEIYKFRSLLHNKHFKVHAVYERLRSDAYERANQDYEKMILLK